MAYLDRVIGLTSGVEAKVVVVGLRHSGKSTLMRQLKPHRVKMLNMSPSLPVSGPCERFQYRSLTFTSFALDDVSGFGNPWGDYYRDANALIFVVDSSDRYSIDTARQQLEEVATHPNVRGKHIPVVVMANKGDQAGAVSNLQLSQTLRLGVILDKPWTVVTTDCLTGEGLHEMMDWLSHQLKRICRKRIQSV